MDTIHTHLTGNMVVSNLVMQGRILRPDGETIVIRNTSALTIPEAPSVQATPRTTAFFLDTADIGLTVQVRN